MDKTSLQDICRIMEISVWQPGTSFRFRTFWLICRILAYSDIPVNRLLRATWGNVYWKGSLLNTSVKKPYRTHRQHQTYRIPPAILSDMRLFWLQVGDTLPSSENLTFQRIWPYSASGFFRYQAIVSKLYKGEIACLKTVKPEALVHFFTSEWPPGGCRNLVRAGGINNV